MNIFKRSVGKTKEFIEEKKEHRRQKLIARYTTAPDIKYRGPLSYRYLRIIAWVAFAFGQLLVLYGVFKGLPEFLGLNWKFLPNDAVEGLVSFVSYLATPLFIVAAFGLILSNQKTFKAMLILYSVAYFGLAIGLNIFFYRYLVGIVHTKEAAYSVIADSGFVVKINVFGDLLAFCLFHFFVNHNPTHKFFHGKKIILFRLLVILPIAFVVVSYILRVLVNYGQITVPFAIVPFVGTKPPLVLLIFALVSLWIRYREHRFKKLGLTRKDYHAYLKTNRNSLSFSIMLSVLIAIFGIIEFIIVMVMIFKMETEGVYHIYYLSIGETTSLIAIIPFIMLYSYTRGHKNTVLDTLLPIVGIGMTAIVYVEVIYQYFVQVIWAA